MKYIQKVSKPGINLDITDSGLEFICISCLNNRRISRYKSHVFLRERWENNPSRDRWVLLSPSTLTDWNK